MINLKKYIESHKEDIMSHKLFQGLYLLFTIQKYLYSNYWTKNTYTAYAATLGYERIATSMDKWKPSSMITRINSCLISFIKTEVTNSLASSYVESIEARDYREEFRKYGLEYQLRLKYPRENDDPSRQGDLIILKPYLGVKEKGVILIQYNDAFRKFISVYDPYQVAKYYRIVLEPSWWGYRDPSILFFLNIGTDVIIQAQHSVDFDYIRSLNTNLIPLRIGAGDWIDPDLFKEKPHNEKIYDIVMVANWLRLKRHELLFKAISKCGEAIKKVALIGYESGGRTKKDILHEAEKYGVMNKLDIYESISREQVSQVIGQSKIGVMLTLREGANRGIYECFLSGVPVIISDQNIGVNREHINQYTGITASDEELDQKLVYLLDHIHEYAPREWALRNTGYKNATRLLNECLKQRAISQGEKWTRDIYMKKSNNVYILGKDRVEADEAILNLKEFLRMS